MPIDRALDKKTVEDRPEHANPSTRDFSSLLSGKDFAADRFDESISYKIKELQSSLEKAESLRTYVEETELPNELIRLATIGLSNTHLNNYPF